MSRQTMERNRFEDREVDIAARLVLRAGTDEGPPTYPPDPVSQEKLDKIAAALEIGRLKAVRFNQAAEERVRMIPNP